MAKPWANIDYTFYFSYHRMKIKLCTFVIQATRHSLWSASATFSPQDVCWIVHVSCSFVIQATRHPLWSASASFSPQDVCCIVHVSCSFVIQATRNSLWSASATFSPQDLCCIVHVSCSILIQATRNSLWSASATFSPQDLCCIVHVSLLGFVRTGVLISRLKLNNRATMEADILSITGSLTPEAASVGPCLA